MYAQCPDCEGEMTACDSGEPDHIDGAWCDECKRFWSDDELDEIAEAAENESDAESFGEDLPTDGIARADGPTTWDGWND